MDDRNRACKRGTVVFSGWWGDRFLLLYFLKSSTKNMYYFYNRK